MNMNTKKKQLMLAAVSAMAVLALAGCGESAPNDANVREAMSRQIEMMGGKAAVESQKEELAKVKVVKCVKAEIGGFTCEIVNPMGGHITGRFKKESEGWAMVGAGG